MMNTLNDLVFVIIGTAAITTFIVATLTGRLMRRREPQVIYVQMEPIRDECGFGCLPLLMAIGAILAVMLFSP